MEKSFPPVRLIFSFRVTHSKENIADLASIELKIAEYCSKAAHNLANCTFEDKHLALDALGIKVSAIPEHYEINGTLPIEITDTSSTMGANSQSCL